MEGHPSFQALTDCGPRHCDDIAQFGRVSYTSHRWPPPPKGNGLAGGVGKGRRQESNLPPANSGPGRCVGTTGEVAEMQPGGETGTAERAAPFGAGSPVVTRRCARNSMELAAGKGRCKGCFRTLRRSLVSCTEGSPRHGAPPVPKAVTSLRLCVVYNVEFGVGASRLPA